jgi:hypothetical protein
MGFWDTMRDQFVEKFFCSELDHAYSMGLREGSTKALGSARVKIEYKAQRLTATKQVGAELAIEVIDEVKELWSKK